MSFLLRSSVRIYSLRSLHETYNFLRIYLLNKYHTGCIFREIAHRRLFTAQYILFSEIYLQKIYLFPKGGKNIKLRWNFFANLFYKSSRSR